MLIELVVRPICLYLVAIKYVKCHRMKVSWLFFTIWLFSISAAIMFFYFRHFSECPICPVCSNQRIEPGSRIRLR